MMLKSFGKRAHRAFWLSVALGAGCADGGATTDDVINPATGAGATAGTAGAPAQPGGAIPPAAPTNNAPTSGPPAAPPSTGVAGMTGGPATGTSGSGSTEPGGTSGTGVSTPTAGSGTAGSGAPMGDPGTPCTGKPGGKGDQNRTWNGVNYLIHYPSNLDANKPVPLIFVAHGFTMNGASMQVLTGFDSVADTNGFVVVYPDGDGGAFPWDVGVNACAPGGLISSGSDSLRGYLDAMRASVEADQCIHPKQIFVTGFSMGGYFSHHVGCQRGNEFARAVGPHSGGTYAGDCPGAPVPIFIMHGAADTFIDHVLCGQGARDLWIPRNGCDSAFDTKMVSGGKCEWYKGCDPNGQTVYCEFDGVGHNWAGNDATSAVWDFFKSYL